MYFRFPLEYGTFYVEFDAIDHRNFLHAQSYLIGFIMASLKLYAFFFISFLLLFFYVAFRY